MSQSVDRSSQNNDIELQRVDVIASQINHNDSNTNNTDNEQSINSLEYDKNEIISIRNVHKTYLLGVEGVTALRGVTFDVKEGEFIIILGTSGGGKTSLLNIMGTIDTPTKGDVFICGQKIKNNTKDKFLASLRLVRLGFVFQTFNLIQSLTAQENVELPMILRGKLSRQQIRQRAKDLLNKVGLGHRLSSFPNMLSGGEQQRVTIVRALANDPKILLLDEPTGDLDTKNSDLVIKILLDLNIKEKITMIMVTHDIQLKQYANRIIKISDGKIAGIQEVPEKDRQQALKELKDIVEKGNIEGKNIGVRSGLMQVEDDDQLKKRQEEDNKMKQLVAGGEKTTFRKADHYSVIDFAKKQYLYKKQLEEQQLANKNK